MEELTVAKKRKAKKKAAKKGTKKKGGEEEGPPQEEDDQEGIVPSKGLLSSMTWCLSSLTAPPRATCLSPGSRSARNSEKEPQSIAHAALFFCGRFFALAATAPTGSASAGWLCGSPSGRGRDSGKSSGNSWPSRHRRNCRGSPPRRPARGCRYLIGTSPRNGTSSSAAFRLAPPEPKMSYRLPLSGQRK